MLCDGESLWVCPEDGDPTFTHLRCDFSPGEAVVGSHGDILWLGSPRGRTGIEAHELGKHQEDPLQTILKPKQGQSFCKSSVLAQLRGLEISEVGEQVEKMPFTAVTGASPRG